MQHYIISLYIHESNEICGRTKIKNLAAENWVVGTLPLFTTVHSSTLSLACTANKVERTFLLSVQFSRVHLCNKFAQRRCLRGEGSYVCLQYYSYAAAAAPFPVLYIMSYSLDPPLTNLHHCQCKIHRNNHSNLNHFPKLFPLCFAELWVIFRWERVPARMCTTCDLLLTGEQCNTPTSQHGRANR